MKRAASSTFSHGRLWSYTNPGVEHDVHVGRRGKWEASLLSWKAGLQLLSLLVPDFSDRPFWRPFAGFAPPVIASFVCTPQAVLGWSWTADHRLPRIDVPPTHRTPETTRCCLGLANLRYHLRFRRVTPRTSVGGTHLPPFIGHASNVCDTVTSITEPERFITGGDAL